MVLWSKLTHPLFDGWNTFAVNGWKLYMCCQNLEMRDVTRLPIHASERKGCEKTHVPKCFLWHLSHFWRSGGHLDPIQSSNPVKILHPSEASPLGHPQKDHFTEIPFAGGFGKKCLIPRRGSQTALFFDVFRCGWARWARWALSTSF